MSLAKKIDSADYLSLHKLNGRSDFIGRLHQKLSWGWELFTKDGYDVITLSALQQRAFGIRSGDWIVVFKNRVWFPYTSYKEAGVNVSFAKFKVGDHTHHMLAVNEPTSRADLYSTISAVFAHTFVESDIRPLTADKQRRALARWLTTQHLRVRLPLADLTSAKTELIAQFIERFEETKHDQYLVVPYSSVDLLEVHLRIAFSHLRTNTVLRYMWNKHRYCGLSFRWLYKDICALYNEHICIVSVARASTDSSKAEGWFLSQSLEDCMGFNPNLPMSLRLRVGWLELETGSVHLPGGN